MEILEKVLNGIKEYNTEDKAHFYNVLKDNNTNKMEVCIGECNGDLVYLDLNKENHLFIGGATAKGKSTLAHSIIISLIMKNSVDELNLWLIDPKQIEFFDYMNSRHLIKNVCYSTESCNMFQEAITEMKRRKELFDLNKCKNIDEYNALSGENLPNIVIVNDELVEVLTCCDEVEKYIKELTSSKNLGIHLIVITQRACTIPQSIINSFENKICFTSLLETSESVLGNNKATLLNNELIYKKDSEVTLKRIYLDYTLISKIIKFII